MRRKGGVWEGKRERWNEKGRNGGEKKGWEKADKEEEGRMGRRRDRRIASRAPDALMPTQVEREISFRLPTLPKLSPLQFYSLTPHSDFYGPQAGGDKQRAWPGNDPTRPRRVMASDHPAASLASCPHLQ